MSSSCFHGHTPYQIIYEQPYQVLEGQMDQSVLFFSFVMSIVVVSTYISRDVRFFFIWKLFQHRCHSEISIGDNMISTAIWSK